MRRFIITARTEAGFGSNGAWFTRPVFATSKKKAEEKFLADFDEHTTIISIKDTSKDYTDR